MSRLPALYCPACRAFREVGDWHERRDLLVVSHYNTIRCLLGRALELPEQVVLSLRVPNAVPIFLRHGSRFELIEGIAIPHGSA